MSEQPNTDPGTSPVAVDRDWLHVFALTVRTVMLANLTVTNSCILSTRVGLAVLDHYGVPARPQPVFVSVHNLEAWRLASERVPIRDWPNSAHSVGIDERTPLSPTTGWNGHLVIIVRQPGHPRLLLDLSADQFDRPIRNLIVGGPVFMDIPDGSPWTPQDPLHTISGGREAPQTIITYRPMPPKHPEAKRWRTSPDWASESVDDFVEQAIERIGTVADL